MGQALTETVDQDSLVKPYLNKLLTISERKILNIYVYDDRESDKFKTFWHSREDVVDEMRCRMEDDNGGVRIHSSRTERGQEIQLRELIDGNHANEAGNTAILGES